MKRVILMLIMGILLPWAVVFGQTETFTLDECIAIGMERSGRLKNARRDEQIAETTIAGIRSQILPHLSASASYSRLDELETIDFDDASMEFGSLDNYAAGATLRQLLYSGGSVSAGLRAAKDFREMTAYQTDLIRATLERDIRAAFINLLLLESVILVHEQRITQLREVAAQTVQRFEQDQASEFDVLNARVQLANATPDLIRASNDWSVAHAAFANLIEFDHLDFTISGELNYRPFDLPLQELLHQAHLKRPEVNALESQMALQQADIRVEKAAYLPTLHLTAGYHGNNPPSRLSTESGWDWRWTAGLQAQWQWLDGGLRRQQVRRKSLEYDQVFERRSMLQRDINQQVRQARLRVDHASAAVQATRENVSLATRSMDIARTQYDAGLTTRLEYTEISLALMQSQLNWLQSLRDHEQAVTELQYAVGAY